MIFLNTCSYDKRPLYIFIYNTSSKKVSIKKYYFGISNMYKCDGASIMEKEEKEVILKLHIILKTIFILDQIREILLTGLVS
jgi:hypothetical protein